VSANLDFVSISFFEVFEQLTAAAVINEQWNFVTFHYSFAFVSIFAA
jgi:hypothetical protein